MSWNNIIPYWVVIKMCNEVGAKACCAFANEIMSYEFREDYIF